MDSNLFPTSDPEGTIKVPYAKALTANWRAHLEGFKPAFDLHAFLIPIVTFQNILKYNSNAEGVRAYIGLEDPEDPKSAKLILVPVVDGNDVLHLTKPANAKTNVLTAAENGEDGGEGDDDPSNVYDLTRPCPTECGSGGLNG